MPKEIIDIAGAAAALKELRERRPLVQNITNYVAMTISANVLLALGASPAGHLELPDGQLGHLRDCLRA